MKITLAWSGEQIPYLDEVLKAVEKTFNASVSAQETKISEKSYDKSRKQYNAELLLDEISIMDVPGDKIILIFNKDIYVPDMNFVFGLAGGNHALISIRRLEPEFYGEKDGKIFKERMMKEVNHELGHTFGLLHCKNPECVMSFSNSILGVDRKNSLFCGSCKEKLRILGKTH